MAPSPSRELRLLANLVRRDRRDPITVVGASLPLHPVPAATQDRNDLTLDVLLALTQKDDVTGPRLSRRRRLRLGHDQRPSRRRADSPRAFGGSRQSGLARCLREERAHQRAQRSAAASPRSQFSSTRVAWIASFSTQGPNRHRAHGTWPKQTKQLSSNRHVEPQRGQPVTCVTAVGSEAGSEHSIARPRSSLGMSRRLVPTPRLAKSATFSPAMRPRPPSQRLSSRSCGPPLILGPGPGTSPHISTKEALANAWAEPRIEVLEEQCVAAFRNRLDFETVRFFASRSRSPASMCALLGPRRLRPNPRWPPARFPRGSARVPRASAR
jgi:hypothetical protein